MEINQSFRWSREKNWEWYSHFRKREGLLEWIILISVPDSLQTNMPPREGISGTSHKAHLPLLWQLLFLVKGDLQNLENTRKFQGKNFYPWDRNHKFEEIYPPRGKQAASLWGSCFILSLSTYNVLSLVSPWLSMAPPNPLSLPVADPSIFGDWPTDFFQNSQISHQEVFGPALTRKVGSY